ncbi:hypothetical protein N0V83_010708 [Neocucurbitaria cava]|uniref:Uncharacterized protein n=1 Tax=Neocucurbitaria cava TaxID=798079 RepID=A0A9W9CG63_9PLEO|nr:hypothetical protein N0V83_010708 [Neocucurbitaria cava]
MIDFFNGATRSMADPGLDLLRKAILSLAVTFFGSQHRQERITNQGYAQYGEVLGQLNRHLTTPERQLTNETLLTAQTSSEMLYVHPKLPPESYKPLIDDIDVLLENLESLYPTWKELNRSQLTKVNGLSKPAKELGITNHVSATAYMLYNTVYICIMQIKQSLSPSPDYVALRNAAAMKIARCLELKEYEMREGAPQSNTITFVATKVAWQALGGFNTVEGRRLAQVVRSAVNGVFTRPYSLDRNQMRTDLPTPDTTFAQYVAIIPPDSSANSLNAAQMMQVWEHQLDVINMGHKQTTTPPHSILSLETSSNFLLNMGQGPPTPPHSVSSLETSPDLLPDAEEARYALATHLAARSMAAE